MTTSPPRGPLRTLTEEDLREQGERATQPPPVPMDELVARMMTDRPATDAPPEPPPEIEKQTLPPPEAALVRAVASSVELASLGGPLAVLVAQGNPKDLGDYLARSVLTIVDGKRSVTEIVSASPLPRDDTLRLLGELIEGGWVTPR